MKETLFEVVFENGGSVFERAFNETQARILAQATRVRNAQPYDVKEVIAHD